MLKKKLGLKQKNQLFKICIVYIFLITVSVLLVACPIPLPYESTYCPIYPEKSPYVRTIKSSSAGPEDRIRLGAYKCFMTLRIKPDGNNLIMVWNAGSPINVCQIDIDQSPVIIEDLDDIKTIKNSIFYRIFPIHSLVFNVDQKVDLVSLLPGFASVPKSDRRYTLSLELHRKIDGPPPETTLIQLSQISIGSKVIKLEPLEFRLGKGLFSGGKGYKNHYLLTTGKEVPEDSVLRKNAYHLYDNVQVWQEVDSKARFSAKLFAQWGHDKEKDKDVSNLWCKIFIEILGDEIVQFMKPQFTWQLPPEKEEERITQDLLNWELQMYTTTYLTEKFDHFPSDSQQNKYFEKDRTLLMVIPNFQPKRIRVTLPPIKANGQGWPLRPIDFVYTKGGVGLGSLL